MWVNVMTSVGPAGRVTTRDGKNFNVASFSNTVKNEINVKLCMMVQLNELYPFIPLSMTLSNFKVTAVPNTFRSYL